MAVLRSLLVTLGLNSSRYSSELKRVKKQTKEDLGEVKLDFKGAAASIGAFSAASVTAMAAFSKNIQQANSMALAIGQTYQELEAMSLIVASTGQSADFLADKFKDVQEKVGDFVATGGGGMQDFFDVMQMSEKQAAAFAKEMLNLTGPEVLKKMVSEMESAGVSSQEMSFALEGLAENITVLMPLLTDGAAKFETLSEKGRGLAEAITNEDLERWNRLAASVDELTLAMKTSATTGLSVFADGLADVTQAIAHYFATLAKGSSAQLLSEMAALDSKIGDIQDRLAGRAGYFESGIFYDENARKQDEYNLVLFQNQLEETREKYKSLMGLTLPEVSQDVSITRKTRGDEVAEDKTNKKQKALIADMRAAEREAERLAKEQAKIFNEMYGPETVDLYMLNLSKQKRAEYDLLLESLDDQNELLTDRYNKEAELLLENATSYEEYIKYKEQLDRNYAASNLQITSAMFGGLSEAAKVFAGEQSGIYKALFAAEKMYHNASIIMSSYDAIAKAWASAPFPANIPAVLQTTVETGALSAALQSVSMVGMAHDGIDEVPKEGTWLLQKGERVVDSRTNADLKNALKGGMGGGNMSVTVDLRGTTGDKELDRKLKESARAAYSMVLSDARSNGAIYKNMRK